jgi:hypothetical protein
MTRVTAQECHGGYLTLRDLETECSVEIGMQDNCLKSIVILILAKEMYCSLLKREFGINKVSNEKLYSASCKKS